MAEESKNPFEKYFDWDGKYDTKTCPYLLPCGLCSRTNNYCPLQRYKPFISWTCDSKEVK